MTLIVSLRIPDGIVLAGDSLSTTIANLQGQIDVEIECPNCGHKHNETITMPTINIPASTFSYAQKILPFLDRYGIGAAGLSQLAGKTIYFALRELEQQLRLKRPDHNLKFAVEEIKTCLHNLLAEQLNREGKSLDQQPNNWFPVTLQVVGYENNQPVSVEISIGKEARDTWHRDGGLTATGITDTVRAIHNAKPEWQPSMESFSLQDAIYYAEFLIRTTASHQQFGRTIPNVGGDIDIALVTPFDDFRWIKQKPLSKLLGEKK